MAGFSFNFSSDDIGDTQDGDGDEDNHENGHTLSGHVAGDHTLSPAKLHTLPEMARRRPHSERRRTWVQELHHCGLTLRFPWQNGQLATLPSSISYSMHTITTDPPLQLPRRNLFDIRAQLLAEIDDEDARSTALAEGLTSDDIQPRLYEGGFKTWECSIDLAQLLVNGSRHTPEKASMDIVEIGAGTAVPSCVLLNAFLERHPPGSANATGDKFNRTFVLADYNEHVLTHASLPNLLLTFALAERRGNDRESGTTQQHGEVEITEQLLDDFQCWLCDIGMTILGVSGAWSAEFSGILDAVLDQERRLVLASETIYQPDSLSAFTAVLLRLLRPNKDHLEPTDVALVAAKKIYFGVGGGVDEFLSILKAAGGRATAVGISEPTGVSRMVLSVELGDG